MPKKVGIHIRTKRSLSCISTGHCKVSYERNANIGATCSLPPSLCSDGCQRKLSCASRIVMMTNGRCFQKIIRAAILIQFFTTFGAEAQPLNSVSFKLHERAYYHYLEISRRWLLVRLSERKKQMKASLEITQKCKKLMSLRSIQRFCCFLTKD